MSPMTAEENELELPGMWERADFTGGDPDERSYAERDRSVSEHEKAIKARREAAESESENYVFASLGLTGAIKRATTVTPEEFDRAYEALMSRLGQGGDWRALRAAFAAAGFEVKS